MGQIIAFASSKGGVGNSTAVVSVARVLSDLGKKVVIVELDVSVRNVDIMLGLENKVVYDLADVVLGNCKLYDSVLNSTVYENVSYIAAPVLDKGLFSGEKLVDCMSKLKKDFDYVIIDIGKKITPQEVSVIIVPDMVILVTTVDNISTRATSRLAFEFSKCTETQIVLLINKVSKRMVDKYGILDFDAILDLIGVRLIGVVGDDFNYANDIGLGLKTTKTKTNLVFEAVTSRILGEYVPLIIDKV